jgi:small subunit ribosomal protein S2
MAKLPTIEEMLKAGMHFGHRTSKWHPKMEPFIYGSRNGVHIIDLAKSRKMLDEALEFMKKFAAEGKVVLFVGTKMQVKGPMKKMAEEIGMPYVAEKWLGGCLTNFSVIRKMTKKYKDLLDDKNFGKLNKYTKKERLNFDRTIAKLELKVGGLVNLNKLPDAMFLWDAKLEKTALNEARVKNVPVIAICDTNTNPEGVNYVIPANDDATKGIKLLLNIIKENMLEGKNLFNKNK